MSIEVNELISKALQMFEKERAIIAEKLILSLDYEIDEDVEIAWQKEIEKRIHDVKTGRVECIPWEDVRDRLRRNSHENC